MSNSRLWKPRVGLSGPATPHIGASASSRNFTNSLQTRLDYPTSVSASLLPGFPRDVPAPKMAPSASEGWCPTWASVANGLAPSVAGRAREAEVLWAAASVPAAAPTGYITPLRVPRGPTSGSLKPQDALIPTTPSAAAGSLPRWGPSGSGLWWKRRTQLGAGVMRGEEEQFGLGWAGAKLRIGQGLRIPEAGLVGREPAGLVERVWGPHQLVPRPLHGFQGGH